MWFVFAVMNGMENVHRKWLLVLLTSQALIACLNWMWIYSNAKLCCRWDQCNWFQRTVVSLHRRKAHQQLLNKVGKLVQDGPFIAHHRNSGKYTNGCITLPLLYSHIFFLRIYLGHLRDRMFIFIFAPEYESLKKKKRLILDKRGSNKQKGKVSVNHGK